MIKRLASIFVGYLIACAASGTAMMLAWFLPQYVGNPRASFEPGLFSSASAAAAFGVLLYSALPTLLTVVYAERAIKRSVSFNVAGGVLIGIVSLTAHLILAQWFGGTIFELRGGRGLTHAAPLMVALAGSCVLGGIVAGIVYWVIAGRHAGIEPSPH